MDFRQDFKKKIHAENIKKIYSKNNQDDFIKISCSGKRSIFDASDYACGSKI